MVSGSERHGENLRTLRPVTAWPATAHDYLEMASYYRQEARRLAAKVAALKKGRQPTCSDGTLPCLTQSAGHSKEPDSRHQDAVARANRLAAVYEGLAGAGACDDESVEVGLDHREPIVPTALAPFGIPDRGRPLLARLSWSAVWATTGLAVSVAVLFSLRVNRSAPPVLTLVGVVTGTLCGGHHSSTEDASASTCVRNCVRFSGGKYALYDGTNVYILSDQRVAERFAAQRVNISGTFDRATRILAVKSIRAAS